MKSQSEATAPRRRDVLAHPREGSRVAGRLALLAGPAGDDWCAAALAGAAGRLGWKAPVGHPMRCIAADGNAVDTGGRWCETSGIGRAGPPQQLRRVLGSAIATPSSKPVIAERPSMLRIEADIRYPTPVNLVDDAVRTMVRLAGKALAAVPGVGADAERIVEQMVARGGEPREDRNTAGTVAATARLGREVPE